MSWRWDKESLEKWCAQLGGQDKILGAITEAGNMKVKINLIWLILFPSSFSPLLWWPIGWLTACLVTEKSNRTLTLDKQFSSLHWLSLRPLHTGVKHCDRLEEGGWGLYLHFLAMELCRDKKETLWLCKMYLFHENNCFVYWVFCLKKLEEKEIQN